MKEYQIALSADGTSDWLRFDTQGVSLHLYTILVDFDNEDGGVATVEFSIERDFETATPICHHILEKVSKTTSSIVQAPMAGIRLTVTDHSNGNITLKVLQS